MLHEIRDSKEWFQSDSTVDVPSSKILEVGVGTPFIGFTELKETIIKFNKIIINGASGVGKNLLARYYCEFYSDYNIYKFDPSKISKFVGQTEEYLHNLFANKKKKIIIVDHMETILPDRTTNTSPIMNRIILQFLVHLDGIVEYDCKFIGITNNINKVDSAIRRPGRIERILTMEHQDEDAIWDHYCDYYNYKIKKTRPFKCGAEVQQYIYNKCLSHLSEQCSD
eukprot:NODE_8_length_66115_cov_0.981823.p34 type:complete len:225 gc:universal NODE_8_length_66115_cov_0.981823:506-1180(+)